MGTGLGDASYRINLCAPAPMSYADRLFINGGFSICTNLVSKDDYFKRGLSIFTAFIWYCETE